MEGQAYLERRTYLERGHCLRDYLRKAGFLGETSKRETYTQRETETDLGERPLWKRKGTSHRKRETFQRMRERERERERERCERKC